MSDNNTAKAAVPKAKYRDDRIRAAMGAKQITIRELARRLGMSESHLSFITRGLAPNPKTTTLEQIAAALEIPMAELFEERESSPA